MYKFIKEYLERLKSGNNVYCIESVFDMVYAAMSEGTRTTCCILGTGGPAVLPDGKFSPCLGFAVDRSKVLGDIWNGFDMAALTSIANSVASNPIWTHKQCRGCFARYWCGGTCYARNQAIHGNIHVLDEHSCDMIRKDWLYRFYAMALLEEKDPVFFRKMKKSRGKKETLLYSLFREHYNSQKR
ncbi:MAG: SPASM domain-containing protein [Candidatus Omnitrophica bacterium]|nr:SPASM domain-containing protein [Candidatus Omnitrophota bacterium]